MTLGQHLCHNVDADKFRSRCIPKATQTHVGWLSSFPVKCSEVTRMVALIRVTDDTTVPEIYECIALVSRTPWTVEREMRIDALLDEVLARRASMADAASA